ncbi:MAG: hypothetical protein KFF77_09665 [Bacteroidetes bacterium]|nr:hypothetical protein [Bacteroidota bacterium]
MDTLFSSDILIALAYTTAIVLAVAVIVFAGCGIARGIRGSGACSFFSQDGEPDRERMP